MKEASATDTSACNEEASSMMRVGSDKHTEDRRQPLFQGDAGTGTPLLSRTYRFTFAHVEG